MDNFVTNASVSVSAVVPVYNAAAYIRQTLDSLLGQEEPIEEIIVVDDGSNDDTCDIVNEVAVTDARIRLQRLSSNQGVSAARNHGLRAARGSWILFLDGDDIADEKLLSRQLLRIQQLADEGYGDILLVHSAYQQIDANNRKIGSVIRWKQVNPQEVMGHFFLRNHIITTSGVLVLKAALVRAGGFNPQLQYAEDWDLWLRIAQGGGFGYVDEPLVFVRRHNLNTSKSVTTGLEGEQRVLRQYSLEVIRTAIFRRNLSWEINTADYAAMLIRLGKWKEGQEVLAQALVYSPDFPTGHFLMGLYYLQKEEWGKARQSFAQTLILNECHGAALNNLGALLAMAGEVNEAFQHLNRALEYYPDYLDAKRNVEVLSHKQGISPGYDEFHFTWRELRPVLLSYSE